MNVEGCNPGTPGVEAADYRVVPVTHDASMTSLIYTQYTVSLSSTIRLLYSQINTKRRHHSIAWRSGAVPINMDTTF